MVLRKSFYIRWSAGRSPRVHEVNPGRDTSCELHDSIPAIDYRIGSGQKWSSQDNWCMIRLTCDRFGIKHHKVH